MMARKRASADTMISSEKTALIDGLVDVKDGILLVMLCSCQAGTRMRVVRRAGRRCKRGYLEHMAWLSRLSWLEASSHINTEKFVCHCCHGVLQTKYQDVGGWADGLHRHARE